MPQPVSATAMTSSWPAWMLSAWLVSARAPTWKTTGSRLPLMTYRTSFIRTRPWPGGEVRDPAAGERRAFGRGRRGMLGLGLDEAERRPPQVGPAVGDGGLEDRGHRGRRRDRVDAGDLARAGVSTWATASEPSTIAGRPGIAGRGTDRFSCRERGRGRRHAAGTGDPKRQAVRPCDVAGRLAVERDRTPGVGAGASASTSAARWPLGTPAVPRARAARVAPPNPNDVPPMPTNAALDRAARA